MFLAKLYAQARKKKATIILAEAEDERVLKAAESIKRRRLANLILIGNPDKIKKLSKRVTWPIIDPKAYDFGLAEKLYAIRKKKGMTLTQAKKLVQNPQYFAAMIVATGEADGYVSGNLSSTADTLRPALQIIKTKERKKAFSYFLMIKRDKKPVIYADCGLTFNPSAKELADIAIGSADIAKSFGISPKIAMLSYSTNGSAGGDIAEKIRKATSLVKKKRIAADELQFDAAFVPEIGKMKAPKSTVAGNANVFIFPDLASGNIAYKISERLGKWRAIGPLMAGLKRPVNDLSRGCSVDDIIAAVAITAIQR